MLSELNTIAGNYKHLINFTLAICPIIITIIMAIIAYEQYKINQHLEYNKFISEINEKIRKNGGEYVKEIADIIQSKDTNLNKQDAILKVLKEIKKAFEEYEHLFEFSDVQLIKESYKELEVWIKETKNWKTSWKEILNSFNVISNFISYIWYADSCYIQMPNKNVTLYSLFGAVIKRLYTFLMPYFIQKRIKKWLYPKIFKLKAILFIISILITLGKEIIESFKKGKTNNKTQNNEVITAEVKELSSTVN